MPPELRSARLLLRAWRAADARALGPLLEANHDRLAPWIPARVATPAPLPELELRLGGYADDFAGDRAYRYALLDAQSLALLGEIDLFPRDSIRRVALEEADRVELGYWLDVSATGQGLIAEAAAALLDVARTMPNVDLAEVRCDAGNAPSAAVPRRLGFTLEEMEEGMHVWRLPLRDLAS